MYRVSSRHGTNVATFIPGRIPSQYKCGDGTFVPGRGSPRYKCSTSVAPHLVNSHFIFWRCFAELATMHFLFIILTLLNRHGRHRWRGCSTHMGRLYDACIQIIIHITTLYSPPTPIYREQRPQCKEPEQRTQAVAPHKLR